MYPLHYTLYTLYTLYTTYYTIYTEKCNHYIIHDTIYTLKCTLYTIYFTIVRFALYNIHSRMYPIHYTLYNQHSIMYHSVTEKTWFFEFQDFLACGVTASFLRWNCEIEPLDLNTMNPIIGTIFFFTYKGVREILRPSPPKLKNLEIQKIMFFLFLYTMEQ